MTTFENGVLRLSNSEMKVWRSDKRHWYLSVYRSLAPRAPDEPMSSLNIGNQVHDALAGYYDQENSIDPVTFVTDAYTTDLENHPEWEKKLKEQHELVRLMIEGYLDWIEETGADADLRILGSERMVEVNVAAGINLISKLDAPVERLSDGAKLALEHKTVSNLEQHMPLLKNDTQFLTEHLVRFLHAIENGATSADAMQDCTGVLLNCLRKVKRTPRAKPPFYGREDVPHNMNELRNHWVHCVAVGREILAARAALDAGADHHKVCPPNVSRDSTWLNPFLKVYAMMDDGSDWEGALADLYEERDPLERYFNAEAL